MTTGATTSTALVAAGPAGCREVEPVLRKMGFDVIHLDGTSIDTLPDPIALCLVDLQENSDALRITRAVRHQRPRAVVIGLADPTRPGAAADAIRAGVFDVLPRPPSRDDLEALIANAREQSSLPRPDRSQPLATGSLGIVAASPSMRLVVDLTQRAAPGRCGVLICGERGSGRELVARTIHAAGGNPQGPFAIVDCSGPDADGIERQLFGCVASRAENDGAQRKNLERASRQSQLCEAAGGVLFLKNVVALPDGAQARMARVLRDREVFIEEDGVPVELDVRPVASADNSIVAAVEEGRLRTDLYDRLSLIRIDVPALRQRREDIPTLATHFLKELCHAEGRPIKTLTRPALTLLSALPWRGNAPELRSMLQRLILLVPHGLIRLEDVLAHTQLEGSSLSPTGLDATLRHARARFERDYISSVLQHHHGRIVDAARTLGIQRTNLYRKLRQLNLLRMKE